MSRYSRHRYAIAVLVVGFIGCNLPGVASPPTAYGSGAAFPGRNGPIVFASGNNRSAPSQSSTSYELYAMDIRSGAVTRLTTNSVSESSPAVSPDGRRIAFIRTRGAVDPSGPPDPRAAQTALYVMSSSGGDARMIFGRKGGAAEPAWSPDGKKIVVATGSAAGQLWMVNANGSSPRRLPAFSISRPRSLSWSPDGKKIAFVGVDMTRPNSIDGIWIADPDGAAPELLLKGGRDPDWSPNGKWIVFWDGHGLGVIRANGTGRRRLGVRGVYPSWSPDGTRIVFGGFFSPHPYQELIVINANGSGLQRLTNNFTDDTWPSWGRR